MYSSKSTWIEPNRKLKHQLFRGRTQLTFKSFVESLQSELEFRTYFSELLSACPFKAYLFETPAVNRARYDDHFEFVLIDMPAFANRPMDAEPFADQFANLDNTVLTITFKNLGGDATLVVPTPQVDEDVYGHLASFVRKAPPAQVDTFWRRVGFVTKECIHRRPIWLNTAGGGVAWLHVRIDSTPKYYEHVPYRRRLN